MHIFCVFSHRYLLCRILPMPPRKCGAHRIKKKKKSGFKLFFKKLIYGFSTNIGLSYSSLCNL